MSPDNSFLLVIASAIAFIPFLLIIKNTRLWAILFLSIGTLTVLQPETNLPQFKFFIITSNLFLILLIWKTISSKTNSIEDSLVLLGILLMLVFIGISNQISVISILSIFIVFLSLYILPISNQLNKILIWVSIFLILGIFIVLKYEPLQMFAAGNLRQLIGRNPALASQSDIIWLGYSYIAFRLLHVLIDNNANRIKPVSLSSFISYTLFFPTILTGPIDRLPRFEKDLSIERKLDFDKLISSFGRIAKGLVYKFVFSNSLALFSLSNTNAFQINNQLWMWVALIAFAWQIYFDFAGITHIAIGIGMLFNIQLPENFNSPYKAENITLFWNRWHITLSHWIRSYFFFPFSKYLKRKKFPNTSAIFLGQVFTMILIGLWHGFTETFLIWGLWHGIALFIHFHWKKLNLQAKLTVPIWISSTINISLTFLFVSLGWVWFISESLPEATKIFSVLLRGN